MANKSICVVDFFFYKLIAWLDFFDLQTIDFFKPCGRSRILALFFCPTREFSLIWRRHHNRWRAAKFDLCSALWPLSSEGSLACHTYCDTWHPFMMVISDTHTYCRAFGSRAVTISVFTPSSLSWLL